MRFGLEMGVAREAMTGSLKALRSWGARGHNRICANPQRFEQPTVMPNMEVMEAGARDIAGYLYTLR
jgi:hypothetical protein